MPKPLRYLSPIHKASRQIGLYFEQRMDGMDLMPQEGHILSYLRSYAPCPVSEVVTVFGLRGSTATSVLDRLESKELIVRRDNPDDRRSFLVDLTGEGRRLADIVREYVDALEASIARRVSRSEEDGFNAVMKAIAGASGVTIAGGRAAKAAKALRTPSTPRTRSRKR